MELYDLAAFRRQKDKRSSLTNPRMTTGFASHQHLKVMRKSKNWSGKGVGRHQPAALRAGMLRSPPAEPELCEDLFWESEHFWLNPVCRVAPGKIWEIQLFLLVPPLVSVPDTDVLECGVRVGGLCWSPEQAPAASWSSVILSAVSLRHWDVLVTLPVCLSQSSAISNRFEFLHHFFSEFSFDCRTGRGPQVTVWSFFQTMCTWAIYRPPKRRCHGVSYSQILFFLVERVFLILIHIFLSMLFTSVFCTHVANRKRILQPAKVTLCFTLILLTQTGSFLNSLWAIFSHPFFSLVGRYFRKLS